MIVIILLIFVIALAALHLTGYSKYILEHIPNTKDYKKKYVDYDNYIKYVENNDCTYFKNLDKKLDSGNLDKSKFDKFSDDVFNDDIKQNSRELLKNCKTGDVPLSETEKKELLPYFEKIKNGFLKKDVDYITDVFVESKLFIYDVDMYFNTRDKSYYKINTKLKYLEKWLTDNGVLSDNMGFEAIKSFVSQDLFKRSIRYDNLIKYLKDDDCTSIHNYYTWILNYKGIPDYNYDWFEKMIWNKHYYLSNKLQKDTNMNLNEIRRKIDDCIKGKDCDGKGYGPGSKIVKTFANIEDKNVKIIDRREDYYHKNDNFDYIFNLDGICGYSLEKPCKSGYKFDNNSCQKID